MSTLVVPWVDIDQDPREKPKRYDGFPPRGDGTAAHLMEHTTLRDELAHIEASGLFRILVPLAGTTDA